MKLLPLALALCLCLCAACAPNPRIEGLLPSTKGSL